jgi:hypothetical protein
MKQGEKKREVWQRKMVFHSKGRICIEGIGE